MLNRNAAEGAPLNLVEGFLRNNNFWNFGISEFWLMKFCYVIPHSLSELKQPFQEGKNGQQHYDGSQYQN